MTQSFPLTLAAVWALDGSKWAVGDALLAECGPPPDPLVERRETYAGKKAERQFPLVLAAIKRLEQGRWAIGDALLAECGTPGTKAGYAALREAAAYLRDEGCDECDFATLSTLRNVAFAFIPSQRRDFGWEIHRAAGSPEFLDAIVAGTPKGTKITAKYLKELRVAWEYLQKYEAREREQAQAVAAPGKLEEKS